MKKTEIKAIENWASYAYKPEQKVTLTLDANIYIDLVKYIDAQREAQSYEGAEVTDKGVSTTPKMFVTRLGVILADIQHILLEPHVANIVDGTAKTLEELRAGKIHLVNAPHLVGTDGKATSSK
jgi:hypothetical protein